MKNNRIDVARAWKDADYRASLTADELANLPENPVGTLELSESELADIAGAGMVTFNKCTLTAKVDAGLLGAPTIKPMPMCAA